MERNANPVFSFKAAFSKEKNSSQQRPREILKPQIFDPPMAEIQFDKKGKEIISELFQHQFKEQFIEELQKMSER